MFPHQVFLGDIPAFECLIAVAENVAPAWEQFGMVIVMLIISRSCVDNDFFRDIGREGSAPGGRAGYEPLDDSYKPFRCTVRFRPGIRSRVTEPAELNTWQICPRSQ
jgi:hypothetical protein